MGSSPFSSSETSDSKEDAQKQKGWGAFAVCVFKRFIIVFVMALIGANFIYLSGLSEAQLDKLFPTNAKPHPPGMSHCCGEPDMEGWPYSDLKNPRTGGFYGFYLAIIWATKDTYSTMRTIFRQLLRSVGGFANGTGTLGRWSTYAFWNMAFQFVGMLVPFVSSGFFWMNVILQLSKSVDGSISSIYDPNKWSIADWAHYYGMKDNMEKSKWLYAILLFLLVGATIAIVILVNIFVALPLSWFVGGGVSVGMMCMFYFTFLFVPMCRDYKKLRSLMACDHKLYLAVFGIFCILDARETLDETTSSAMAFVYFMFVLHAIYTYLK